MSFFGGQMAERVIRLQELMRKASVCVCVRCFKGGKFKSKQVCETVSHASRSAFIHAFFSLGKDATS